MERIAYRNLLDNLEALRRMDRSDMLGYAQALPFQCQEGWQRGLRWRVPASWGRSSAFLVLGVGGSAIGGDVIGEFCRGFLTRPVLVNRHYTLPAWVGRDTLVLVCSYSGNTEETLTAAFASAARGARVVALTSGGKLAQWARVNGFPLSVIPGGLPPRAALGYQIGAPLGLLARLRWLKRETFPIQKATTAVHHFIQRQLSPFVKHSANPAKKLAARLYGTLPILYGSSGGWEALTYRWRTQLEENAKTLAFHHIFPEATHNEISGWLQPKKLTKRLSALFLMDPAMHPRVRRRMEFTAGIVRKEGAQVLAIRAKGASLFERTLKLIALGDFVSIYLGLLYRVDPTPVARVEALKRYLGRRK